MSSVTNEASYQTISFTDRMKENFREHKWQILVPGPVGLAALAATVVFLVSNPFGWAFSAGIIGTGIAFATLNAISSIGYSLYYLLKERSELKNSFTPIETPIGPDCTSAALLEGIRHQFPPKNEEPAPIQKKTEQAPPAQKKKGILKLAGRAPTQPRHRVTFVEPSKSLKDRILENPVGSALTLGSLLLGGYGLYSKGVSLLNALSITQGVLV